MSALFGNFTGNLLRAVGGSVVGGAVGGALSGPILYANQGSLQLLPMLLPTVETLMNMYHAGRIEGSVLMHWLRLNGVPSGTSAGGPERKELWNRTIDYYRPILPLEKLRAGLWSQEMTPAEVAQGASRLGLAHTPNSDRFLDTWGPITIPEALVLRNRGDIDDAQLRRIMARNGVDRMEDQDWGMKLRYQIPYHGDLISFAVREVFSPEVVARFNYDAEFPPSFQMWMEKMGMGWKPSDLGFAVPPDQDISWARSYWRAHWQMMSPTAAERAVHFLRPGNFPGAPSRRPGVPAFTRQDFDTVLRIADYPPVIRDWLYGLSFTALTRVDIRRMYRLDTITTNEVYELYRDIGYDETNAARLRDFTVAEALQIRTRFDRQRIETTLRELWETGIYNDSEFLRGIYQIRIQSPALLQAFNQMTTAEQLATASARPELLMLLQSLRLKRDSRYAKKTIGAVRKAMIKREISNEDGRTLLQQAGIENAEITRLLSLWAVEQSVAPKAMTASQVLNWMKRGAITPQEAGQRLALMGFRNRDIAIMIAVGNDDRQRLVAREQERMANTQQQVLRAQAAQLKAMYSERARIIADLNKSATRPAILKFLQRGYISIAEAYAALRQRGVFPKDAYLWIRDALKTQEDADNEALEKLKTQAEEESRQTTGANGNGQGLSPPVSGES